MIRSQLNQLLSNKCERLFSDNERASTFFKEDISINAVQQTQVNLDHTGQRNRFVENMRLHYPTAREREILVQTAVPIQPIANNAVR